MNSAVRVAGLGAVGVAVAVGVYALLFPMPWHQSGGVAKAAASADRPTSSNSITLGDQELNTVKVEVVGTREFGVSRDAVGKIAFNDDATVPVFPPYQGRITQLYAKPGQDVTKGQILFEIDSPDLVAAESSLITAVGNLQQAKGQLDLTTRA
ncbi:MAG TPA: efflux RND transporter periplasmic adaptor subunit, partial [Candidatus Sulfotelmatobacter sp.]|nr:efflux RND transporter periplasmic adaptor subunit [Candidatus Sulfotelmatobacter sp.]